MSLEKWADELMETSLIEWGGWAASQRQAQGWGGASQLERHGSRRADVYSNPTAREYERMLRETGRLQLIDTLLSFHPDVDRKVVRLRYVGEREVLTTKIVGHTVPEVEKDKPKAKPEPIIAPLHSKFCGMLTMVRVGELCNLKPDAVRRTLDRVKERLALELIVARRLRHGVIGEVANAA